jgi:hypothetical protein
MTKKQTSVKWLQEAMQRKLNYELSPSFLELFEQAKAMEKEQIESAYWDGGQDVPLTEKRCEQYYNETFEA